MNEIKFSLGKITVTQRARRTLTDEDIINALKRHQTGDWGDCSNDTKEENERALKEESRLFSIYHSSQEMKFYVVTEKDRKTTTVLFSDDY